MPAKAVVFTPLEKLAAGQVPEVVIFLADPDQLAALIVLANYGRPTNDNVIVPFAAGCQSVGILAYREAHAERPRAVLGLVDLSARLYTARQLGPNLFTLALPWTMFLEMEDNVVGSFLERSTWASLLAERDRR